MENIKIEITAVVNFSISMLPKINEGINKILLEKNIALNEIRAVTNELLYRNKNMSAQDMELFNRFYDSEVKRFLSAIVL